jgi:uncharacterized membrane protein YvlD (DUF360 family)
MRHLRLNIRIALMWVAEAITIGVLILVIPGITAETWAAGLLVIVLMGLLNTLIRPVLVYLSIPPTVWTYGIVTLATNVLLIWLAGQFLPGFTVVGIWPPLLVALGMGLFTVSFGDLLAIDDDDSYYHHVVSNIVAFYGKPKTNDKPGILFLEIDGLSETILRRAISDGHMPTLASWLETGSHQLIGWECDLSSQTSASQAGILLGNNFDIPAFRWFEKDRGKQMVSNFPADTAEIERRLSTGGGLLAQDGASRSNLFSGDAPQTMFTFSTIRDVSRHRIQDFYPLWMGGYNFLRMTALFIWDVVSEIRAASHQRRHDLQPRMHRGGIYPLLRASTTVLLRELSLYILIGDMYAGVSAAYTTFFGYDEVAHHSGIAQPDVFDVLRRLDSAFDRLQHHAKYAPRPYHFVVLSDHGQSQGATFKQRYGVTLKDVVRNLISEQHTVKSIESEDAGWANLSVFLTGLVNQVIPDDKHIASRLLRRAVRSRTYIDQVVVGPYRKYVDHLSSSPDHDSADVVVLASGNLGLIYFTDWKERMSYEQINETFPEVIEGLVKHDGISFVMVRSEEEGPLAIGERGVHFLSVGRLEGEDPLAFFGPNACAHLKRTDSFPHVADIMVNSLYDPDTGEVAAFEELVGSHGGLGGDQSSPFLLYPAELNLANNEIVEAAELHKQLKQWLDQCRVESNHLEMGVDAIG